MSQALNRSKLAAQELLAAVDEHKLIRAELDELIQRRGKLRKLINTEADAEAELARVVSDDAGALTAWVGAGATGDAPVPDQKRRATAASKLAEARHQAGAAKGALVQLESDISDKSLDISRLETSFPGLRVQAIVEAMEPIAARLRASAIERLHDEQLLLAAAAFVVNVDVPASFRIKRMTEISNGEWERLRQLVRQKVWPFLTTITDKPEALVEDDISITDLFDDFLIHNRTDKAA